MSDQTPDPQPPFDFLPDRFKNTAYADLPAGMKRRVDQTLAKRPLPAP